MRIGAVTCLLTRQGKTASLDGMTGFAGGSMWQPDIATLRLLLDFAGLLSLLTALLLWRVEKGAVGTGPWALASGFGLAACLLPPAVMWRQPDMGIAANSSLTLSAMLLMLEGALRFRKIGVAAARRLPLVMGVSGIIALMLMAGVRPWLRVVLHDVLALTLLAGVALVLFRRAPLGQRLVSGVLASVFLGLGGLFAWRGAGILAAGLTLGGADTRTPPWLLAATLAWLLAWTVGMALLVLLHGRERERALADRDQLTGMANRTAFLRDGAVMLPGQGGRGAGILLLSLEGLRPMNESLGHAAGDHMLAAFAARLRQAAMADGAAVLVGRLTGAQFALLLPGMADRGALVQAMDRLRLILAAPLVMQDIAQPADYSLGAALYPQDGSGMGALLEVAERAMFKVKAARSA